jgi:hypothetical protein
MSPRPLDLGPIRTLTNLSRLPFWKMLSFWLLLLLILVAIFVLSHWPGYE